MNTTTPLPTAVLPAAKSAAHLVESQVPSEPARPATTEVMVILTARHGVTRERIMAVMPNEIQATVRLYLEGRIRQWYSRGDGKGAVFLLVAKTEDEARAVMEALPLAQERLMDHDYIAVGPLLPLAALIGPGAAR